MSLMAAKTEHNKLSCYCLLMSVDHIRVRYDGPSLAEHYIDVEDLAPALLAIGDLCKIANKRFNGNRASVKVFVNADLEQGCFELDLRLAVDIIQAAKQLVSDIDFADATEILKWLGILGGALGAPLGILKLLSYLKGRKITEKKLTVKDGQDVVQITVEGDNNNTFIVYPQTAELLDEPAVISKAQRVVEPLSKDGYETLEFESSEEESEMVTAEDAKRILAINNQAILDSIDENSNQVVTALLRVYSPVYESDAENWRFWYGERHEYMNISDTDIAEKAMERGGALADDLYKVRLEIRQSVSTNGRIKNHYKILSVIDFTPAKRRTQAAFSFFDEDNKADDAVLKLPPGNESSESE